MRLQKGVRNLSPLCAGACEESDEIVNMEKVPGNDSELTPVIVQEPIGSSEFWVLGGEF